jgi:hypothetical protein
MGRYSVVEPDQKILDQLSASKNTLIVGCTNCANISIGYDTDTPIFQISTNKSGDRTAKPVAINREAKRLKRLLENRGMNVDIELHPLLCGAIESENPEILASMGFPPSFKDRGIDTVLALTCSSEGLMGLKHLVRDDVRVVPGMHIVGGHEPVLSYDKASGNVFVNRDKSVFKRKE